MEGGKKKKKFKHWRELCFLETELVLKMLEGKRFFRINSSPLDGFLSQGRSRRLTCKRLDRHETAQHGPSASASSVNPSSSICRSSRLKGFSPEPVLRSQSASREAAAAGATWWTAASL